MASATAGPCCDIKKAATTPASVGAAAAGTAFGSRMGDGLLWRPNGLLSEQDTLTGKAERGLTAFGAPDSEGA
jgi:hypothetical protein